MRCVRDAAAVFYKVPVFLQQVPSHISTRI